MNLEAFKQAKDIASIAEKVGDEANLWNIYNDIVEDTNELPNSKKTSKMGIFRTIYTRANHGIDAKLWSD